MSPAGGESERVRLLIARERPVTDDRPGPVGLLQRLCRAAAGALPATGVGVSVVSETGTHMHAAASDRTSELIEELQLTLGEGPCIDSYASRRPVLTSDLATIGIAKWPAYVPAAHAYGVRAVFAFPMQVGTVRLGVMDVYRDHVGALSREALSVALSFADIALQTLIQTERDGTDSTADRIVSGLGDDGEKRFEVYQAQGMLMVQLGVSLGEAMIRLRAYTFTHDRRLLDVARDVVAGRLRLERDD